MICMTSMIFHTIGGDRKHWKILSGCRAFLIIYPPQNQYTGINREEREEYVESCALSPVSVLVSCFKTFLRMIFHTRHIRHTEIPPIEFVFGRIIVGGFSAWERRIDLFWIAWNPQSKSIQISWEWHRDILNTASESRKPRG